MKQIALFLFLVLIGISCSKPESNETYFLTKLGSDTLAVEAFKKTADGFTAKVVLRSPQTVLTSYTLKQDEFGGVKYMTATRYLEEDGFSGKGTEYQKIERKGDSLFIKTTLSNGTIRNSSLEYQKGVLPFIDMVHWPFELALISAEKSESDTVHQKMISGSNISNFILADLGGNSRTVRHPSRGIMDVNVNEQGEILILDAAKTTRKLVVTRASNVDLKGISNRFLKLDREGKPFGSLSGAVEKEFTVKGTTINITHGSPSRRGRVLFGGIVPWGERWRTGADRATHFSTSKDIKMGNLEVPAGEYTLFSIPEADGGKLIINKQTGQNGQTYNEDRDLGRVPMQISSKPTNTEVFSITVEETETGGTLNLIWGETVFTIPFVVK